MMSMSASLGSVSSKSPIVSSGGKIGVADALDRLERLLLSFDDNRPMVDVDDFDFRSVDSDDDLPSASDIEGLRVVVDGV